MTEVADHPVDDILRRAAEVLGDQPAPTAATGSRIVIDDGGDGSAAAKVAAACGRLDAAFDIVVGSADDVDGVRVVVFVVDTGCDNSSAMGPLIARQLRTVGRVALVCNEIDVFWNWPARLADFREQVDPWRLCPLFAVASEVSDDPASGIGALVEWLRAELGDAIDARSQLTAMAAALWAITPDDGQLTALRHRRAELVAERDRGRSDRLAGLRIGLTAARGSSVGQVHSRLRMVSVEGLARVETISTQQAARAVGDWLTDAIAECERSEIAELWARAARIEAVALLGIDAGPRRDLPLSRSPASQRALPNGRRRRSADDALVMVFGASTGLGIGRLVATQLVDAGLAGWSSMAATVLVGLAMALWVVRARRQAALRTAMRQWVTDTCADARTRIEQTIFAVVNDVEPLVVAAIARHYERDGRRAAQAVADIDTRLRKLRGRSQAASEAAALGREIARRLNSESSRNNLSRKSSSIGGTESLAAASK
ncbi:hypothetical protein GOEFS_018_00410 [Gordonia effusa NBRC 100432]|uniref:Uncharacterized protein n=1 Tax=Gordonia effusa NBRC 100432 TaxID=1077974 RepID=H0QW07_9ACTN|nr:hypothetical protein [Gordonia effusa]GAB17008.1 hypothetical protein GOEFS_018_00410 [Gordonia effusa NBRC 100432]